MNTAGVNDCVEGFVGDALVGYFVGALVGDCVRGALMGDAVGNFV